jgi:crotonobetainyl-CoA:carnitine CoA-transferase CaiB-like acyl-CoA transferase
MMPLEDILVLDLSRAGPGPYATMLLADFGARVIRVEDTQEGDPLRHLYHVGGVGAGHLVFNRNKESLGLNLKEPRGREIFLKLARRADVLLESFRPGVMDRLGVGYQEVQALNPGIIYCAISGYGQDGPYRQRPGHDLNYISLAGMLGIIGQPGGPPVIPGVQIGDAAGGMFAALGILLSLRARERTGRGQFVDISMLDGVVSWLFEPLIKFLATGNSPRPGEERLSGGIPAYNIYRTRDDRYITLGILEPHLWRNLCQVLGKEDLLEYQFAEGPKGARAREELAAIFASRTLEEWGKMLEGADVCWAPVNTFQETFADPQVRQRELLVEVDHPIAGKMQQLGIPLKLSETPGALRRPAPAHGEHTLDILGELGCSQQEAQQLKEDGIIAF